jgi:N-methylhydantoinase A
MTRTLAVDVGGTFTDVVLWDGIELRTAKVPSTPADQSVGVMAGARAVADGADRFLHGTTVATNALLERTGARTALITSDGFEDVLEIGRQHRPSLYDPAVERPPPLVPRDRRLTPGSLDASALKHVESVAVSLLYAYQDASVELAVRSAINALRPELPVSVSSEVAAEFREFERASTTVLNAYVMPVMARYLSRLAAASAESGFPEHVLVMRSSGGLISAREAATHPASALLSGPAGGVVAATELGRALGHEHLISFDMGGTSTDVARIDHGRPELSYEREIAGYPCRLPSVAIHTVGAGGGSLGWVDPGGALRVGPQSAGAHPGPAAYGHGGLESAVTDANLVLGRIDPAGRLGSELVLQSHAAVRALSRLGDQLGMDARQAAAGMVEVVEEAMAGALRRVSIEQGVDPRGSVLVAFGGAGGLHGTALARRLGMAGMLVPLHAGVFSALGLLLSRPREDWAHTVMTTDAHEVDRSLEAFHLMAEEQLRADGVEPVEVRTAVDVRYVGQSHELTAEYVPGEGWDTLASRFHRLHAERNGFARPDDDVEAVTVRVDAVGSPVLTWSELPAIEPAGEPERGVRRVLVGKSVIDAAVWWRPGLAPGAEIRGPAIVEEPDATTFLYPGDRAVVHDSGALEVEW